MGFLYKQTLAILASNEHSLMYVEQGNVSFVALYVAKT